MEEATRLLEEAAESGPFLSREFLTHTNQKIGALAENIHKLEVLMNELEEKEEILNIVLNNENVRQMESLAVRLRDTYGREMALREREREEERKLWQLEERNKTKQLKLAAAVADAYLAIEITSEALEERLRADAIMKESEIEMKRWILTVIEEELALYKQEIFSRDPQIDVNQKNDGKDGTNNDCPSITSIVQKVQQALSENAEDGIGKVDHAQGASVVHWLTSDTYSPPALPSQTLGSVWWSQFIPQDWERLFPPGWEKCQVTLPSYVSHSLGFVSGDVAPPEAIVEKNTLPGSCWPMKGSSGQVVLKLTTPIVVESVSIDHVSRTIIPEGKQNSAPKHAKITGYPPCDDTDEKCLALGFDMDDPIEIADIHYDLEGLSVQTFESNYAKAMASLPKPADFDEVESDSESGSCSVQTSCSTPPRISVAAVVVNVLENWGNQDFTCVYRVRLHGDPS
eukprot:jgi/Psemu1/183095/e_gw1.30.95.1